MDEKEVLNGYVIDVAMWIGHKRVCFGIAEDQKAEYPYMMCVYESEGYMFPVCDKLHCFDNYPEALHAFANKMQDKRINAGYEIIKSFPVGNTEFVLGENIHDRARYVTWECTGGNNYFWGHYFTDKEAANKDLYDRVEAEVAFKRSIGEYPKENEPKKKTNRDREER